MSSPFWPPHAVHAPEGFSGGGMVGVTGGGGAGARVPLVCVPVWSHETQCYYGVYKRGDEYQFYRAKSTDGLAPQGPAGAEWVADIRAGDITREIGSYRVRVSTNSPLYGIGIPNHVPARLINELYSKTLSMQSGSALY